MDTEFLDDLEFFDDADFEVPGIETDPVDPAEPVEPTDPVDPVEPDPADDDAVDDEEDKGEPAAPAPAATEPSDAELYKSAYELYVEKGLLTLPEDFKFEPTEEGFEAALKASAEHLSNQVIEELKEGLPEEGLALIKYMKDGGKDISKFIKVYSEPDYSKIELEDDAARKQVLVEYYKKTTKWSDAKIEKHLNTLELSGDLEEESDTAVKELAALQKESRDNLTKEAQDAAKARDEAEREAIKSLKTVISSKKDINGYPISKADEATLIPFLMKPIKVGDRVTTAYNYKHAQIMQDPEKAVLLAKLIQSDLDLSVLNRTQATKVTKSVKEKLQAAVNHKGSVTSSKADDWDDLDNI